MYCPTRYCRCGCGQLIGIRFAPLHIPPHRRLQTAAVALWALLMPLCVFIFLLIASVPRNWYLLIPYVLWILLDRAPDRGGRPKTWARGFPIWKYFARKSSRSRPCKQISRITLIADAEYYPCSIVKVSALYMTMIELS
jgi:hypothetical protein